MADVNGRDPLVRAKDAEHLLNHPEFKAAINGVRQALFQRIEACPLRDEEGQRMLQLQLKLLRDVQANLQAVINTGKVLEQERSLMDRMKQRMRVGR